jgi:hydrogenase-4 component B
MSDPPIGLLAALAIRLAVVALTLALRRSNAAVRWIAFGGSAVASLVTVVAASTILATGSSISGVLFVHVASGFALGYTVDALSAWFLLVLSVVSIPIAIFSIGYLAHGGLSQRAVFVGATFNVLLGAVEMTFIANDVIGFLFAWELMTLATAALVATEHEHADSRRASLLYLVMSHVGTGCLIAAFMTLASLAGSFEFAALLAGDVVSGATRDLMFLLFFLGFGVKAGVIPLHIWLPDAHPAAPTSISALMSGVVIKAGIYGLVRMAAFGLGTPRLSWGLIVVALGGLSAVLGVLYALMQHDLKRLLAYHSIENIGIILLGLGAGMIGFAYGRGDLATIGIAASLYHVLNHAVFKALLFLSAGGVLIATGTRQIEAYGGLLRRMPWTGLFFLIGAMAISGLPPLNGFASEWLTFQAFLYGFHRSSEPLVHFLFPLGAALLALTTALAAACFVKAFGISFLALPRSAAASNARESPAVMLLPQAFLAIACIALGIFPGAVLDVLATVTTSLRVPASSQFARTGLAMTSGLESFDRVVPAMLGAAILIGLLAAGALTVRRGIARRVPTWGCGGELNARTEYTATAFSKPLMLIFRAVYRPARQVEALAEASPYFPREVRYHAEIEPTFERYVYGPLLQGVLRIASGMKVLQAGSLHAYLAYVITLVVSLVLFVWWTS